MMEFHAFWILLIFEFTGSLGSEQSEASSLFQNDLGSSEPIIPLDNTDDLFSASVDDLDGSSASTDVAFSFDPFDLKGAAGQDSDPISNGNDIQSPDLYAPISIQSSDDSAIPYEPFSSSSIEVQAGEMQNLALLDEPNPIPLLDPFEAIRGIYDSIQNLNLFQAPPPEQSQSPPVLNCGLGYFPFCCLQGPPIIRYPARTDRRAKCYTCEIPPQFARKKFSVMSSEF